MNTENIPKFYGIFLLGIIILLIAQSFLFHLPPLQFLLINLMLIMVYIYGLILK